MKKILFLLLFTVSIYGQTLQNPTYGTVTEKNNATDSTPAYFTTTQTDGVHKKTPAALVAKVATVNDSLATKENVANKQNSLAVDGTGGKFPTVDAVNGLRKLDYTYETKLNEICTIEEYFTETAGVISTAPSGSWGRSPFLEVSKISGVLKTYLDELNKPAISYFSDTNLGSYISSEYIAVTNSFYNTTPTVPTGAKYFIIQCLASQFPNSKMDTKEAYISNYDDFYNVLENQNLVVSDIWTNAIQDALRYHSKVYIPFKNSPYLIDKTLLLKSGQYLKIDPRAVIKMTAVKSILSNKNLLASTFDSNITLEGGIFDQGGFEGSVMTGARGAICFLGTRNLKIKNISVINTGLFGVQINCADYLNIDGIHFDISTSDGLHMGGNINDFIINNITGQAGDDLVALNAWDWRYSSPRMGDIVNGKISNVNGYAAQHLVRLLGANQDGTDYTVDNITIDNVKGFAGTSVFDIGYQVDPDVIATVVPTKLGNISIYNTDAWAGYDMAVKLSSDIAKLEFKNCEIASGVNNFIKQSVNTTIDNLTIDGFNFDGKVPNFYNTDILYDAFCRMEFLGTVKNLAINNSWFNANDTSNTFIKALNIENFTINSTRVDRQDKFFELLPTGSVILKAIGNKISATTDIAKLATSATKFDLKLIANEFSGSGFVVNNDIGSFTPNIEFKQNSLTTIQKIDGLGNIFENVDGVLKLTTTPTTSTGAFRYLTYNETTDAVESVAQSDLVAQTITNGVTTSAPSQDAVFDALAGKASLSGAAFTGTVVHEGDINMNGYRFITFNSGGSGLRDSVLGNSFVTGHPIQGWSSNTVINSKSFVATDGTIRLKNYTVATLPAGVKGDTAYVTDATAPTYLGTLTGGGTVVCPVFYNGTSWVAH